MKTLFSIFCLFCLATGFSQIVFDTISPTILIEVKKDKSGKYIKRTFKDASTGILYEYVADPDKFIFEVKEDVVQYLQKQQTRFNETLLYGVWTLKQATDFSGKNLDDLKHSDFYERLEFNSKTKMFIRKQFSETTDFTGCYSLNKKTGILSTQSTSELSQILFPKKEGDRLPKQCIKSDNFIEETLFLYTLNSDHLVLYTFIPHPDDEELEQTVFLHYIKVHY